jgi:tetratricopeptide (TPR) repeat protein
MMKKESILKAYLPLIRKGECKKWQRVCIVSIFFMLCCTSIIAAQDIDKLMKLRIAQGYEETGEWESAVTLYEELYKSEPTNFTYIDGLQRSYTQIKEYDKAITVIRRWLTVQPRDINLMTSLGGLYYDSGNEATADSIWKAVLSTDTRNVQLYHLVANEMMEHRLYEQCIRMYLDARSMSKNDAMFADELGTLYIALQQYASATKEYLRLLETTQGQLSFVQSRISTYTSKPEALRVTLETVSTRIETSPDNIALRRLYAWLLMEDRNFHSALDQYQIIDHLSKANGYELYSFAQRLSQEHASRIAAEAFNKIITENKNPLLLPYARFGYAQALEEISAQTDMTISSLNIPPLTPETESLPTYQDALQLYESITSVNTIPDLVAQAFFRIGFIKFDKLFDLDGALAAFNRIKNLPQTSNILYDAVLKIGDVQIARNDLVEASKEFDRCAKIPLVQYQDQAAFKLAELEYFEAQFDSSLFLLKRFNVNLNTDLTNDALQLQYFIQENKETAPQALTEFAKADLLTHQRKYSESLTQFQDIIKRYPAALLVDDAMMKIGELHLRLRQPNEALATFRFIADSISLSILKDRAQFRIAEIYQSIINNKTMAIEAYEKLLTQFPNSLYAEESRKRIRMLRGDSI